MLTCTYRRCKLKTNKMRSKFELTFSFCSRRNPITKDLMLPDDEASQGLSSFWTRCIDFRVAETTESPNKTSRFRPETLKPETYNVSFEGQRKRMWHCFYAHHRNDFYCYSYPLRVIFQSNYYKNL